MERLTDKAERAILAAIMTERVPPYPINLCQSRELLRPEHFADRANRTVFEAAMRLHDRGEPVDMITLQIELNARRQLESVGGAAYLVLLADSLPTAAGLERNAAIIAEGKRMLDYDSEWTHNLRYPKGQFPIRHDQLGDYNFVEFRPRVRVSPLAVEPLRALIKGLLLEERAAAEQEQDARDLERLGFIIGNCDDGDPKCYLGSDKMIADYLRGIATEAVKEWAKSHGVNLWPEEKEMQES